MNVPLMPLGALALWMLAVGLLTWESVADPTHSTLGWALMTSAAAAAWSVVAALYHVRCTMVHTIVRQVTLLEQASKITQL